MLLLQGHRDSVFRVAYSPDGRWLASAGADRTVRVWDLATHKSHLHLVGHRDTVWNLAFSTDGTVLASGGFDGRLIFWEIPSGKRLSTRATENLQVRALARGPGDAFTIGRWQHRRYSSEPVLFWQWSSGGQYLGTIVPEEVGSVTGSLSPGTVWTRPAPGPPLSPELSSTLPIERILCLGFSPDGHTLAFAEQRRSPFLYVYSLGEGVRARGVACRHQLARALLFLPSPSGPGPLAVAENQDVFLWDVNDMRIVRRLAGHDDWVYDLARTADGSWLASAGRDGTVRLWDPATGRQEHAWRWDVGPLWSVDVAPDGLTAAVGGEDGSVVVWDLDF